MPGHPSIQGRGLEAALTALAAPAQTLEKEVHPLVSGFYDTPFITWLLKTETEYRDKVFFEDQIGINRHFVAIDWGVEPTPLVAHFAGERTSRVP